jgi:ATP-binding cassette subfamily F protein 3
LNDFAGTIIVVSHDRYFLDRIVDRLIVVGVDEFGNRRLGRTEFVNIKPVYSYYSSLVRERQQTRQREIKSGTTKGRKRRPSSASLKQRKKTPHELKRFNRYSPEQIEGMITSLEKELAEIRERFGEASIYKNPEQFSELQQIYDGKNAELELLYQAFEHRAG